MVTLNQLTKIDTTRLENESRIAYSFIAHEYYNELHMTCRAFDSIDKEITGVFQDRCKLLQEGKDYIEVGAGKAALLRRFMPHTSNLIAGDITAGMALNAGHLPKNISYRQFSVFRIPFPDQYFNGLFGFLIDSFNVQEFYLEASRVVKTGGFILITIPTKLWADTYRKNTGESPYYARFPTLKGSTVLIPSITWFKEEYQSMLVNAGFNKFVYEEYCLPSDYPMSRIPETITLPARVLDVQIHNLPLITVILAYKD